MNAAEVSRAHLACLKGCPLPVGGTDRRPAAHCPPHPDPVTGPGGGGRVQERIRCPQSEQDIRDMIRVAAALPAPSRRAPAAAAAPITSDFRQPPRACCLMAVAEGGKGSVQVLQRHGGRAAGGCGSHAPVVSVSSSPLVGAGSRSGSSSGQSTGQSMGAADEPEGGRGARPVLAAGGEGRRGSAPAPCLLRQKASLCRLACSSDAGEGGSRTGPAVCPGAQGLPGGRPPPGRPPAAPPAAPTAPGPPPPLCAPPPCRCCTACCSDCNLLCTDLARILSF